MTRRTTAILAIVVSLGLFACADPAGSPVDLPSFDQRTPDPPKDFVTLIKGQLQLPPGAQPYASAYIDGRGGSVRLNGVPKNGLPTYHEIVVPPGAVNERTLFVIQLASREYIDVDLYAYRVQGPRWEDIGHAGFAQPVTLTLSYAYATTTISPDRFHFVYLQGNRVREHVPAQANQVAKSVVGQLRHFSRWAVGAE